MFDALSMTMVATCALLSHAQPTTHLLRRDGIHHPTYLDSFNYTSVVDSTDMGDTFSDTLTISFHQDNGGSTASFLPGGTINCAIGRDGSPDSIFFDPNLAPDPHTFAFACSAADGSELPDGFSVVLPMFLPLRREQRGGQPEGTNRNVEIQIFPTGLDNADWEGYEFQRLNVFTDSIFQVTNRGDPPFSATLKRGGLRLHENGNNKGF